MATNYQANTQIEKMQQLKTAYNKLVNDLDQRLKANIADLDDPAERNFWYNRWRIIHELILADYFKWMDDIVMGRR